MPAPFLGVAVVGSGDLTAAIDAYGGVADLRAPGPAGGALIANPADRQAAGSVPPDTGIVVRVSAGGGAPRPLWRARRIRQRYLPRTNVLRTVAWLGRARVTLTDAARDGAMARRIGVRGVRGERLRVILGLNLRGAGGCRPATTDLAEMSPAQLEWKGRGRLGASVVCDAGVAGPPRSAGALIAAAARADRRWLARGRPLAATAPAWAERMRQRSLLVLRALTDRRSGAMAAGIRDGWAYVWPRDAAAAAIAFAGAGHRREARRIAGFLASLGPRAAARFGGDGSPVRGRAPQGDAAGWVRAAARAAGRPAPIVTAPPWRSRADYGERAGEVGDYLGNAIASGLPAARLRALFGTTAGLVRRAGDSASVIDSATAWAARPFPRPALFGLVRRSLRTMLAAGGRFGIEPSSDWPGEDPWSAPTAWSAWGLAALGDRAGASRLMADLRRAATPSGTLPERVGASSGIPRSTTPLGWSHAFASLALEKLFPPPRAGG
jgi:glucoamylase